MSSTITSPQQCYLTTVPPEVLKVVVEGAGAHAMASLWRCGNMNVNRKLSTASGASTFDLWLPNTARLDVFPSLLTQLQGLNVVRIELRKDVGSMPGLTTILLASLSPRMKEISLRFKEAEECWKRSTARKDLTRAFEDSGEAPFDFASHFPCLEIFKLVPPTPHQNVIMSANATSSSNQRIFGSLVDADISSFSENLRVLELPCNDTLTSTGIKALPPLLDVLNLSWMSTTVTSTLVEYLPRSLRTLILTRSKEFKEQYFTLLPRTLEHLDIRFCLNITGKRFGDLPGGLLYFNCEFSRNIGETTLAMLPRKLTYLNLGEAENLTTKSLSDLPTALTYLDIWNANISPKSLNLLPESLLTLKLGGSSINYDAAALATLPKNLTHLNMESANVAPSALSSLPGNLIILNLYKSQINESNFALLPRTIQRLRLRIFFDYPATKNSSALPKGLKDVPNWWV